MKYALLLLCSFLVLEGYSCAGDSSVGHAEKIFVRLYDMKDKKIGKGILKGGTDSTIILWRHHKATGFAVKDVFLIVTRRSAGHTILVGTAAGIGAGLVLVAASAATDNHNSSFLGPNTTSFDLGLAGLAMPAVGIVTGSIVAALQKHQRFKIGGNLQNWLEAKSKLLN